MSDEVVCPADEWTELIENVAAGMPAGFDLYIRSDSGHIEGTLRITKGFLPFGIAANVQELPVRIGSVARGKFQVERGWLDSSFKVEYRPTATSHVKVQ